MEKIKIFEMFAGCGSTSFALKKANIDYEIVGFSEIDKYAIQCYNQNHFNKKGLTGVEINFCYDNFDLIDLNRFPKNYGDCTKINPYELPDFDLLTGGFPCQAFSNAGNMKGELDPRGTLVYDIIRIAEIKKPKYMLLENVKGFTFKKFEKTFEKVISELKRIGYVVWWKVLNSKDYGTPQNRERVWFVCYRKDIFNDFNNFFSFPKEKELTIFLKDILEKEVDKKYYLSESNIKNINRNFGSKGKIINLNKEITSPTLTTAMGTGGGNVPTIQNNIKSCALRTWPRIIKNENDKLLRGKYLEIRKDNVSNSLTTHNLDYLLIKNATKKGYIEAYEGDGVNLEFPNSNTRRGRVQKQICPTLQCNDLRGVVVPKLKKEISNTLTTELSHGTGRDFFRGNQWEKIYNSCLELRRLTPKECFRLQGFFNDEINLKNLSDTQKYKIAGNGQDINLLSQIFIKMFKRCYFKT